MVSIQAVATVTPPHTYSTQEIIDVAGGWLKDSPRERDLFARLSQSTKIDSRSFALPLNDLLGLRGTGERSKIFTEVGTSLLASVIAQGLAAAGKRPSDVTSLITTSCSVPTIPAIDSRAIAMTGLPSTVFRVPVFQYGCAGGAVGIALARHLVKPNQVALLASVELCSLVYQGGDLQAGNIVGSAIFGDGAACVVLSAEEGPLRLVDSESFLIPDTVDLMGYDIFDDGTHLRLDREIPQALLKAAPRVIKQFLSERGLSEKEIAWWLFHPGGAKILSSLEELFGLTHESTKWAWESLRTHGNMSSASILFALKAFLEERCFERGDKMLMLGIGPGLTLQVNLFECGL
jgi:alkylresorcinol/alkylpyrone synthase